MFFGAMLIRKAIIGVFILKNIKVKQKKNMNTIDLIDVVINFNIGKI